MQRITAVALGYEDLSEHNELNHNPMMAVLAGGLAASVPTPLAAKSALDRLEPSKREPTRYAKIVTYPAAIKSLFGDLFLDTATNHGLISFSTPTPRTIHCTVIRKGGSSTVIMTATVTCRSTASAAGFCWCRSCDRRTSTPVPARWRGDPHCHPHPCTQPQRRIVLRADSGFRREALMARAEAAIALARPVGHFRSSPGGYFHGMVTKAKTGELNLARTIWGLRARDRRTDDKYPSRRPK